MRILRLDCSYVEAAYVKHVRTLSGFRSHDVDLFRLEDGTDIEAISPTSDSRAIPEEIDPNADHCPGHKPGE